MPFQAVFDAFARLRQERTHFSRVREQFLSTPVPEVGRQYDASSQRLLADLVELNARLLDYHTELARLINQDLESVHQPKSFTGQFGGWR